MVEIAGMVVVAAFWRTYHPRSGLINPMTRLWLKPPIEKCDCSCRVAIGCLTTPFRTLESICKKKVGYVETLCQVK